MSNIIAYCLLGKSPDLCACVSHGVKKLIPRPVGYG